MTIIDLKEQIIHKKLGNFYVFAGEEIGIMNIYLNQMSKVYNLPITRAESVASVYSSCTTRSMFGNKTGFYVIRNDKEFTKQDKYFESIKKDIGQNVIVLLFDKVDSRLKFAKAFKNELVVFEKLAPNVLKSYIKKAIKLSDTNAEKLMEICNGNYDMCMLEIDKIDQYQRAENMYDAYSGDKMADKAFETLLNSGAIYQPENSDVFKFSEAVCLHKTREVFDIEKILRDNGVSAINILGTLYNSMKSVMLIQCCKGKNIKEITGLDGGQIYFNRKYVGVYPTSDLVRAVKIVNRTIAGIKNGIYEDEYAVRYVLACIL